MQQTFLLVLITQVDVDLNVRDHYSAGCDQWDAEARPGAKVLHRPAEAGGEEDTSLHRLYLHAPPLRPGRCSQLLLLRRGGHLAHVLPR